MGDLVEDMNKVQMLEEDLYKKLSLEYLEMTIPYLLKFLSLHSYVMDKLMVDTMLILRHSANHSTYVLEMEMEA